MPIAVGKEGLGGQALPLFLPPDRAPRRFYTKMVSTSALLLRGDVPRHLDFDEIELLVALLSRFTQL